VGVEMRFPSEVTISVDGRQVARSSGSPYFTLHRDYVDELFDTRCTVTIWRPIDTIVFKDTNYAIRHEGSLGPGNFSRADGGWDIIYSFVPDSDFTLWKIEIYSGRKIRYVALFVNIPVRQGVRVVVRWRIFSDASARGSGWMDGATVRLTGIVDLFYERMAHRHVDTPLEREPICINRINYYDGDRLIASSHFFADYKFGDTQSVGVAQHSPVNFASAGRLTKAVVVTSSGLELLVIELPSDKQIPVSTSDIIDTTVRLIASI